MGLGVQEVYWIAMPVKGREGRKQYWAQNDFLPQCLSDTCQRKEREKEAGLGRECPVCEADLTKSQLTHWGVLE